MSLDDMLNNLAYFAERKQKEVENNIRKKEADYCSVPVEDLKKITKDNNNSFVDRAAAYRQYEKIKDAAKKEKNNRYTYTLMKGPNCKQALNDKAGENKLSKTKVKKNNGCKDADISNQVKISKNEKTCKEEFDELVLTQKEIDDADIIDLVWDTDETDRNYRKTALFFTDTNHGWIKCPKCGRNFRVKEMDADHILPKSKGGDNTQYNLQMLCQHCNRSKQADTSDTDVDLERRKKELEKTKDGDRVFLSIIEEMIERGEI